MSKKTKLELTWIGKDNRPKLEPRILLEDTAKSYSAKSKVTEHDIFDNHLIYGDNLLALKALEQDYTGKIKCIYIDPPYNTGSAFTHYDDGIEHSLWLSLMRDRLEILNRLLSEDGSIWISIDDNEAHYLKVLCDEIFGRENFIANVIWQRRTSPDARATLGAAHDHILVFSKNIFTFKNTINLLLVSEKQLSEYKNPDNDPKGPWISTDLTGQTGNAPASQFYTIKSPSGNLFPPPTDRCWALAEGTFYKLLSEGRIWFGKNGNGRPRLKRYLSESQGVAAWTWWSNAEVGHNQEAKKEIKELFQEDVFDTPKPERLLERIIHLASNPGDMVLDSFAGSGTTGAVAHKMGRRWIMIELGEHCHTHIIPRMQKVIDGTDQGGISKNVNWQGGGGFRYSKLAPSLLQKDKWGNWVFNPEYNPEMLAEAMCKHTGFKYQPSDTVYWQQGKSSENDYIYVTTQVLTLEHLQAISEDVGTDCTLLVCCAAYTGNPEHLPNLTVQKIPRAVLNKCEWGKDDYSLNIQNLPPAPVAAPAPAHKKPNSNPTLFDQDSHE